MILLAGRLLREGLLQQSALSERDAASSPARSAALVEDAAGRRGGVPGPRRRGVPATTIEEADFSPVLRAREERRPTTPVSSSGAAGPCWTRCAPSGDDVTAACAPAGPSSSTRPIEELRGPLAVLRGVQGVGLGRVRHDPARPAAGTRRHGLVLEVEGEVAVVQVLEGTAGMDPAGTGVAFGGTPLRIPVGAGWLGRVCNGRGDPLDGGPPVLGGRTAPVAGWP